MFMKTVIFILNGTVTLGTASIFFPNITLEKFIILAKPIGGCRGYGGRILLLIYKLGSF